MSTEDWEDRAIAMAILRSQGPGVWFAARDIKTAFRATPQQVAGFIRRVDQDAFGTGPIIRGNNGIFDHMGGEPKKYRLTIEGTNKLRSRYER